MKKAFLILTASLLLSASWALADITLSFDDHTGTANAGTYAPGATFSFDIMLSITSQPPNNVAGFSLWFETAAANSGLFTITALPNHTGSPFSQVTGDSGDFPAALTTANSTHSGFAQNAAVTDLGATSGTNQVTPGTYFLETITFSISGAITPGTYTLMNTSASTGQPLGKRSVVNDGSFNTFDIASSTYTITIVPEPATLSLVVLGALGTTGLIFLRRKRQS
jgi:PEP-CTERM motif